jgi:hypothetical protein
MFSNRIISLKRWAMLGGASALALLTGCGGDDLRCGDGTVEQQDVCVVPEQPTPSEDTTLTLTSLEIPTGPMLENHRMKARLGLKGTGDGEHFVISLGLMEVAPTEGDIPTELSNCLLTGTHVYVKGGGAEQFIDLDFTVSDECQQGKKHNLFVSYATDDGTGQLAGSMTVFNQRDIQNEQNQQCRKRNGEVGCVYEVELRESPGLDVHVTEITPSSKVAVAYPDSTSGHSLPLMVVGTDIMLHGRARGSSSEVPGGLLSLTYSIAPLKGNSTDWQLLDLDDDQGSTATTHYPLTRISPRKPLHVSNHLHATTAVRDRLQGAWAQENVFKLRACVESSLEQDEEAHAGGESGTANDCQVITIQLVRATSNAGSLRAGTQSWDYSWSEKYGGDSLSLTPSFSTTNVVDLTGSQIPEVNGVAQQGAMASVNGQADLGGDYAGSLASSPLFQGSVQAVGYVAVNNSFVSGSVNAFGYSLYSFNKTADIPNPIYSQDWSASKELCQSSTYVVVVIPITLEFCGSGTIGLKAELSIGSSGVQGQTGQGGQVQGTATPYAKLDASLSASVGVPGVSVGVQGSLTLISADAPLNTTLTWGLTGLSPLAMDITGNASLTLDLGTLDGDISLVAEYPSVQWCDGWLGVEYPCELGTSSYTDPFISIEGLGMSERLLNANQTLSLSL